MKIELKPVLKDRENDFLPYLLMADESEEAIRRYAGRGELFEICADGKTAGVLLLTEEAPGTAELKNIALAPEWRGKGIGKEVIRQALFLYKEKGYTKITVGTANSSIANLAFYQKAGFRITGIRKDFFLSYPEPIFEDSIRALDMIMFEQEL